MSIPGFAFSRKALRTSDPPISFLMAEAVTNPNVISLAAGLVDYDSLPTDLVARTAREILEDEREGKIALQYGTTAGLAELRDALLSHFEHLEGVSREALSLTPDHVVVGGGSQQVLYLISDVLLNPGDIAIMAAPSYFVHAGALESLRADIRAVPADDLGMRTDALAELLGQLERTGRLPRVKLIYIVSYFENPTGLSLSAARREELFALAQSYSRSARILILEDAAYRELRYDGPDLPSIKSLDRGNEFVATAMTFSKPFAAGLKTGYAFMPSELTERVLAQKGNHDFGSANFSQHLLLRLMKTRRYQTQVERARAAYVRKRDAMLAALDEELVGVNGVHWTRPNGGLYVWLTLPEAVNTNRDSEFFRRCVDRGVLYVPGQYCYAGWAGRDRPQNHLRLSFGVANEAGIAEGVRRLASCVRDQLSGQPFPVTSAQT